MFFHGLASKALAFSSAPIDFQGTVLPDYTYIISYDIKRVKRFLMFFQKRSLMLTLINSMLYAGLLKFKANYFWLKWLLQPFWVI